MEETVNIYKAWKDFSKSNPGIECSIVVEMNNGAKYDFAKHDTELIKKMSHDKKAFFLMDNGQICSGRFVEMNENGYFVIYNLEHKASGELPLDRVIGWCYYDETVNKKSSKL